MSLSRRAKRQRVRGPRRKRMTRQARLASAAATRWVERYGGRNLIRGYARWFGVDQLSAVLELRRLGVAISPEEEERARQRIATVARQRAERREATRRRQQAGLDAEWAHAHATIAGSTAAGFSDDAAWQEPDDDLPWPWPD